VVSTTLCSELPQLCSSQQGIHLGFVEVMNDRPGRLLEWDCSYFTAPGEMFRTAIADEDSQGMDGCQALIVRVGATVPHLSEIGQETAHQIGRDLGDLQFV